jgi:hypothetical protein
MSEELIKVRIVGIMPSDSGIAVFIGNEEKTFSLHVDQGVGTAIAVLLRGEKRERPLTHDLIHLIFQAFAISVEKIVINDMRNETYFARILLRAENEIHHQKITEIDARPSDCLAIALQEKKPIYITPNVWEQVVDVSPLLEKIQQKYDEVLDDEEAIEDEDENDLPDGPDEKY